MSYPYVTSPYQNLPRPIVNILDLLDVKVSSLTNGQVLKYNGTTKKWENSLDLNTTEAAAPLRGVQFNSGGLLTGSNNFLFTTSNRLQLGSQTASSKIHISDNSELEASLSLQNLSGSGKEYKLLSSNSGSLQIRDVSANLYLSVTGGNFLPGQDIVQNLGSASLRWNDIYGQNSVINTSDRNQKKDIEESDLGLDFILKLKPVCFKWENGTRKHYGLIAQDVKECIGDRDFGGYIYDPESKTHGLRYTEFFSPLIKAIQEIQSKINTVESTNIQLIQDSYKELTQSIPVRLIYNIDSQLQEYKDKLNDKESDNIDKLKELEDKLNHLIYTNRFNVESQVKENVTSLENIMESQIEEIQTLNKKVEALEESNKLFQQYTAELILSQNKKIKKDKQIVKEEIPDQKIKEQIRNVESAIENPSRIDIKKPNILESSINWFKDLIKNTFKKDC